MSPNKIYHVVHVESLQSHYGTLYTYGTRFLNSYGTRDIRYCIGYTGSVFVDRPARRENLYLFKAPASFCASRVVHKLPLLRQGLQQRIPVEMET
jgi:hypothetical protein